MLGMEIVEEFRFWADDPGGPLMISSDGGDTKLALFEGEPPGAGAAAGFRRVAFRVNALGFLEFRRRFAEWNAAMAAARESVEDHGKAYSIYFSDPYGHLLEVTTYEYDETTAAFAEHGLDTP